MLRRSAQARTGGSLMGWLVHARPLISHTYVPYGLLGEADLSGNLLSPLLLLGIAG